MVTDQAQHDGTISHTGNGDTIGSYQHERSNTIVVSLADSSVTNTAIQIDDDSPPHHIKPPAYNQSEALPSIGEPFKCYTMCIGLLYTCIDASNYPPLNSHQQPPPAYEADPSKPQYPQRTQYHQEVRSYSYIITIILSCNNCISSTYCLHIGDRAAAKTNCCHCEG